MLSSSTLPYVHNSYSELKRWFQSTPLQPFPDINIKCIYCTAVNTHTENKLESSAFSAFGRQLEIGLNKQNRPIFDKVKTTHKYKRPEDIEGWEGSRYKILRLHKVN